MPRLATKVRLKWDRRGGRTMLLYPERGLALNEAAVAILALCDGQRSVDAIVGSLVETGWSGQEGAIRRDVEAFLGELQKRGLVTEG